MGTRWEEKSGARQGALVEAELSPGRRVVEQTYLKSVLLEGANAAGDVAGQTNLWAKKAMGFTTREDLA